jgi:type III secretion system FlhB-like substrate exporter
MSKIENTPVATFDMDSGIMLIGKSIDDLILQEPDNTLIDDRTPINKTSPIEVNIDEDEDEDDGFFKKEKVVKKTNTAVTPPVTEEEEEEDDVEKVEKVVNTPVIEDEGYENYTDSAIYGLALKQINPDFFGDLEIDKELEPSQLLEKINTTLVSKLEEEKTILNTKYESVAQYMQYIIDSDGKFDQNVIKQGMDIKSIADIELTDETSDEDLEYIVKRSLYVKGMDNEEDIDSLITRWKDSGKLFDKAEESIELHKKMDKDLITKAIAADKERKKQEQITFETEKKLIEKTISKGEVSGIKIKNTKEFMDALYKPTEIVEQISPEGIKTKVKVPLFAVKQQKLMEDVEKRLAYVQLILNDFTIEGLKETATQKVNENIIDLLNNRSTNKTKPNRNVVANGWLS